MGRDRVGILALCENAFCASARSRDKRIFDLGFSGADFRDQAHRHRVVGFRIDQDEAAEVAVFLVALKRQRPIEGELAKADLVRGQMPDRRRLKRVEADACQARPDGGLRGGGASLDQQPAAGLQRGIRHPENLRVNLARGMRRCRRPRRSRRRARRRLRFAA